MHKNFYDFEQSKSFAAWKRDYWIPELVSKIGIISNYLESSNEHLDAVPKLFELNIKYLDELSLADHLANQKEIKEHLGYVKLNFEVDNAFLVLQNEIQGEMDFLENLVCNDCLDYLSRETYDGEKTTKNVKSFLNTLKKHYNQVYSTNDAKKDELIMDMGIETYKDMVNKYTNESLDNFVLNNLDLTNVIEYQGRLIQKSDPIYKLPKQEKGFLGAHFYAPTKYIFGSEVDSFWANLIVIWGMILTLIVTLYFDILKKIIDLFGK